MSDVWGAIERFEGALETSGELTALRADQARSWLWSELQDGLLDELRADPAVQRLLTDVEQDVIAGTITPSTAARKLAEDGVAALQNGDAATAVQKLEKAHNMLKAPSVALWSARALAKRGLLIEAAEAKLSEKPDQNQRGQLSEVQKKSS